jgi:hypothetical protein
MVIRPGNGTSAITTVIARSSTSHQRLALLELMIPLHYRLGCTVVVRPSRIRVVPGSEVIWFHGALLLELMIPPHYRLGSTVVVRPSRFGVVPGSIPGLAILFSSYNCHDIPAILTSISTYSITP